MKNVNLSTVIWTFVVTLIVAFLLLPLFLRAKEGSGKGSGRLASQTASKSVDPRAEQRHRQFTVRTAVAKAKLRSGQFAMAEQDYLVFLDERPGYHEGWLRLAQARIGQNKRTAAKEALERYLALNPRGGGATNMPEPLVQTLEVAERLNDGETLNSVYHRILMKTSVGYSNMPTHLEDPSLPLKAKALASLGWQHRSSMTPRNGISLLERAIAIAPESPTLHFVLGDLLSMLGIEYLERSVQEYNLSKSLWIGRGPYPHVMELTRSNAARFKSSRDRWLSQHPDG